MALGRGRRHVACKGRTVLLLGRLDCLFLRRRRAHARCRHVVGDVDEIEACMLDANNDTLLGVDVTTAEDGTKTFRF